MAIFPEFGRFPWETGPLENLIWHHKKKKRRCRRRAFDRTILFPRRTNTNTNERENHMTKLYAVLVGSLLLAGGSSAIARPDADDTLTQIHRLPNEIIGAAELKPVFHFGRRLQDGGFIAEQAQARAEAEEKARLEAEAKAEAEAEAKARAKAEAKTEEAMAEAEADLKALLAEARERTAKFELKAALEEEEAEEARAYAEHAAKYEADLKAALTVLEARRPGVDADVSALFDAIRSPLPGRRLQVDVGGALAGMVADDATNLAQAGAEQVAQEAVSATLSASGMSQQQAAADDVAKAGVDAGVTAIADAIGGPFGN